MPFQYEIGDALRSNRLGYVSRCRDKTILNVSEQRSQIRDFLQALDIPPGRFDLFRTRDIDLART